MAESSRFSEKLAAYDQARLREAFDRLGDYNRTTLNRWLEGALPQRGEFIERLAAELEDPALYEAWQAAKSGGPASSANSVVRAFERLTPEEKDGVFHDIRGDYVSTIASVRSRLTYTISIDDPEDPHDDHLRLSLNWRWTGDIPANATLRFETDPTGLGNAYDDPSCVFREELPFDPDRLQELLAAGGDQVLTITDLRGRVPEAEQYVGRLEPGGIYRFDNPEASSATIHIAVSYPFPRRRQVFYIRFGKYQVPDTAEVTLILNSPSTSSPTAFAYMPPGRQREWFHNAPRPNELFVSLGTGTTVLSEGDGVVLHWSED